MTKLDYLQEQREMAYHNLLYYSRNYSMTVPKEGREEEWHRALEQCRIVEMLIAEEKELKASPSGPMVLVIDKHVLGCWDQVREAMDVLIQAKP